MEAANKLPLPIGSTNYKDVSEDYYYIDKTLMIKDLLDERVNIALFTRPRRFGKTLNMDMLRTFFEKTSEDTSVFFKNKKIWQQGAKYTRHQGQYPVIFLSFKDAKQDNWQDMYEEIKETIKDEYYRHIELQDSSAIKDKDYFTRVLRGEVTRAELARSILRLSDMLRQHYHKEVILIIDEYDTPIQSGHIKNFYDDVINFMRNLLSAALKDNRNLACGFLTGILRVAKESIFSGLNNVRIYSVLDRKFSRYFGFTDGEVAEMASYYGVTEKLAEIKEWYDGYRFGDVEIYNPWSVLNYFDNDCIATPYWVNTSSNSVINEILDNINEETYRKLQGIVCQEDVRSIVEANIIYPEIGDKPENIFGFLLMAGYLKAVDKSITPFGSTECRLCIPNKELRSVYYKEIIGHLSDAISLNVAGEISKALMSKDGFALKTSLNRFLLETISFQDTLNENYYHGLMLGISMMFYEKYRLYSNRESGMGRFDIALEPKEAGNLPGLIIELKAAKSAQEDLQELAAKALAQIEEKRYDTEMKMKGVATIYKYGIAFFKKTAEIVTN